MGIESAQGIGVEFGEPDGAMRIKYQLVWRARQRECLACMAGVGNRERGQGVDLVAARRGEVVPDVVGVLFHEPDRIVGGYLDRHHARASARWGHLLKRLGPWVKDSQEVPAHFSKPEASFVIDGWPHHLAIGLR